MIKIFLKLIKALNSDTDPHQISLALGFAMIMGLTPLLSLHNLLVLLLIFTLRINISSFILGFLVFSGTAYLLDPIFHKLGFMILTLPPLKGIWTELYNMTIFRIENFNNSLVMGSLFLSMVLFIPFVLLMNMLIKRYRENVLKWVEKSRIIQGLKATKIYRLYEAISEIGGAS